ncbi:MAG: hypothetical protein SPG03_06810 [Veillonella caviae]|uniref:hypothetical protein n=1 Tax=Veillonella caviae TaxID=248316 RepID=UPI002A7EFDF3|nr:hypothetical protein [Veillonella caviae]MDY4745569.1 hypothetical protein [Veillonella caviae]MDY5482078.1 hypothetical protein [Veillonella caviae]
MEFLLASPIVSIIVAYVAFKTAFFTIKKVAMNVVTGFITYWVCVYILNIPMDIGFGIWALTVLFGPIPMILAAVYYWL